MKGRRQIAGKLCGTWIALEQGDAFRATKCLVGLVTLRHPPMSAIRPFSGAQRTLTQRVIRSASRARDKPAPRARDALHASTTVHLPSSATTKPCRYKSKPS